MKAISMESNRAYDMSIKEIDYPTLGPHDVVIKVSFAGICGTDLKIYQGKYKGFYPPVVLGHEFSGCIAEVGEKVKRLSIGDNVTASPSFSNCGHCLMCASGRTNVCTQKLRYGFDKDGAFAEYIKVHENQIHLLPEGVDLKEAAMIEPLAVVVHALRPVNIKPSDVVLIIGPGTIGLLSLLLSKANGATVAIAGLSKDYKKLLLAQNLGADLLINAEEDSGEEALMQMTNGQGADIILECSGSAGGINQGLKLCKPGGRYVQVGTWSDHLTIDFMKVAYKEIEVTGSYGHTLPDWYEGIQLLHKGKVKLSPLIEGVYSFEDWKEAFKVAECGERTKVIFKP